MHPQSIPQEDLVSRLWPRCCGGDKVAFGRIAEHCYPALFQYGTKFSTDRELIKDSLQDLFLDIWEKRERLVCVNNPRPYLFRAFRNNLLHRLKAVTRFSSLSAEEPADFAEVSFETEWIRRETDRDVDHKLHQILNLLPKRQREALYLRYYENLSYEEIAEVMGLRRQAVANYLQYGIRKIKEYWEQVTISVLAFLMV